ncbi:type 2 lanthipeptide synthetase LanM [Buttiauxella selenatireducens]|uniref:Type 2 lanthipeptide synthetase LanM n=1 Tax=Buttiauxella selenatireducens TaxID=3073902 RepID=A0ABY9S4Q1_9ENTR|nr:type 2 lanthipeptide synthetase LanM [Buttiauxella sp. R73]WMY72475.1 type 2 lanthipeptide synthetase LanM [Buttiauxella sp. R73]
MKYHVTEPYRAYLFYPHLQSFDSRLKMLLSSKGLLGWEYSGVLRQLAETLDQIYLPDFVVSFDKWLLEQEVSSTDRYKQYFKNSDEEWRESIRGKNEFVEKLAAHVCESTLQCLDIFSDRLLKDKALLTENFYFPSVIHTGVIDILGGDRHENGQQPVLLTVNDQHVVYKPRDAQIECVLNKICNISGLKAVCPETLSMKTHIWQKFIPNQPLSAPENAEQVYTQYGNILALADLLNINDCHFDNFIVDKNRVYFIDSETSFQYFFSDDPDYESSIYQSGLLQSPEVLSNGIGHTSAITAVTNIFQSYTYPHAVNDGSEQIQVHYEQGFLKRTHNYPHHGGNPVLPDDYIDNVILGYENGYEKLLSHASEIISLLGKTTTMKPRYLIRTTAYYMLVINKIIHPGTSLNIDEKFSVLINEYLHYDGAHPRFAELIPYEAESLIHYNVPIFQMDIHSTSIMTGSGQVIPDFFIAPPLEQVKSNFTRPPCYIERQRELIRESMNVHIRQ